MIKASIVSIIINHLSESARVKERTADFCKAAIEDSVIAVTKAFESGGKLLLCGNGGSAADCQHIAAEFTSVLRQDFPRPGLPAIALTTDSSFLTARGNDYGFDGIFERLVDTLGNPGDVLIGISTSGNSKNVCAAMEVAGRKGLIRVAFTGESGGKVAGLSEIAIRVPSYKVQHIQEAHIAIGHILCQAVEEKLYSNQNNL